MPMLAVGGSRPLCLEAALVHVTLHTAWELCPQSPTPVKCWWWHQGCQHRQHCHRSHQTCTKYRDDWTHWPGLNSGLLRGEHEPETHTTNFPNSGIHILAEAHPSGEAVFTQLSGEKSTPQRKDGDRGAAATLSSDESGKEATWALFTDLCFPTEFSLQVKANESSPPGPLEGAGTCTVWCWEQWLQRQRTSVLSAPLHDAISRERASMQSTWVPVYPRLLTLLHFSNQAFCSMTNSNTTEFQADFNNFEPWVFYFMVHLHRS